MGIDDVRLRRLPDAPRELDEAALAAAAPVEHREVDVVSALAQRTLHLADECAEIRIVRAGIHLRDEQDAHDGNLDVAQTSTGRGMRVVAASFGQTKVKKRARTCDPNVEIRARAGLLPPFDMAVTASSFGQTKRTEVSRRRDGNREPPGPAPRVNELALSFGRVAALYDRVRPEYSQESLDRAQEALALDSSAHVLDLAAGTGRLTHELAKRFARVVSVEPDDAMRAFIAHPEVLAGTAEEIPLPDSSVDAVFVGEAFHWFDGPRAVAEITRVADGLAVLARSWGIGEEPELLPQPFRNDLDEVWRRFHPPREVDDFPDWRGAIDADGEAEFVDRVAISGRDLVDLHMTGSTVASISEDERAAIAERAYPLMDDAYELRVVTTLYWKRFA